MEEDLSFGTKVILFLIVLGVIVIGSALTSGDGKSSSKQTGVKKIDCAWCDGYGFYTVQDRETGEYISNVCSHCGGKGYRY